jgi:hypothetical protein
MRPLPNGSPARPEESDNENGNRPGNGGEGQSVNSISSSSFSFESIDEFEKKSDNAKGRFKLTPGGGKNDHRQRGNSLKISKQKRGFSAVKMGSGPRRAASNRARHKM